jgi:hypothetical protein
MLPTPQQSLGSRFMHSAGDKGLWLVSLGAPLSQVTPLSGDAPVIHSLGHRLQSPATEVLCRHFAAGFAQS